MEFIPHGHVHLCPPVGANSQGEEPLNLCLQDVVANTYEYIIFDGTNWFVSCAASLPDKP